MRKHQQNRKFHRMTKQRRALLNSLARSLILYGKIQTTEAKAKELRPYVEKMVTKSKENTLANRRLLISRMGGEERAVKKLFEEYGPAYADRSGGYTRIIKLPPREGDASPMAQIEFV